MSIKADEITNILKREIENYNPQFEESNYGTVIQVGDNIAQVYGLSDVLSGELFKFEGGQYGIIFNLEEYSIGCVILGDDKDVQEGHRVERTGRFASVPVGEELLGRVVNPLGQPIDGKGPIEVKHYRPLEVSAPSVIDREPVKRSLYTGIKAIDALIPIGRGQRELIIGDRQTGKTTIAIDTIINQIPEDVYCIYVAVGQKASSLASAIEILKKHDRLRNTTIVAACANEPASLLYLAPYAGCAMAEYYMYSGRDALVIYDDLTKHANAYRELSLLLGRPPGREAYPGDVFYLHSRLLERSAQVSKELGGGSSTALPIIETQLGDVSAYIPTNVISITDGQIFLERDLFLEGVRPAVDVTLSVSRVGGSAQIPAMKKVAGTLRLDLSQFRELESFTKFSSDELDPANQKVLTNGQRIVEALKQSQYQPLSVAKEVAILYAAWKGYFDDMPEEYVTIVEKPLTRYIWEKYPQFEREINETGKFTETAEALLREAIQKFKDEELKKIIEDPQSEFASTESFQTKAWKAVTDSCDRATHLQNKIKESIQGSQKSLTEE